MRVLVGLIKKSGVIKKIGEAKRVWKLFAQHRVLNNAALAGQMKNGGLLSQTAEV